jgi:hypothetical protein
MQISVQKAQVHRAFVAPKGLRRHKRPILGCAAVAMARRAARSLLAAAVAACLLACAHARARATLAAREAAATAAARAVGAAHAHGSGAAASASGPPPLAPVTQAGPVEMLAPGLYRASYRLQLPATRPGEVLNTRPSTTLLGRPAGRVAVLNWQFDLLDAHNRSVPLSQFYNHHVRAPPA